MNRTIKFRGQDYQRHWHYGSLVIYNNGTFAIAENDPTWTDDGYHNDAFDLIKVRQETVGESTGLFDKNGKEVYEGDILSNSRQFGEIVFDEEKAAFKVKIIGGSKGWIKGSVIDIHLFKSDYDINIIGNIHDNPELLKEKNN